MWTFILQFMFKVATSEVAKVAIGMGVNKLLEDKEDGITKDIAETMIDGIAKSKSNPTKIEMFDAALSTLKEV